MSGTVEGKIVAITDQGNLVSDIAASQLEQAPRGEELTVLCDEHETRGLFAANHDQPESTFIAVLGENGCLELEIVGLSAAIMLGIQVGESVSVCW